MKNKNVHILPTDKPSRLAQYSIGKYLFLKEPSFITPFKPNRQIYITSDEEIKTGDWSFDIRGFIEKVDETYDLEVINALGKKIILTTDTDLIKDGIQEIPDEFLEWFVKNPSCEEVGVTKEDWMLNPDKEFFYKIIIPKEESKQEWLKNPKWGVRLTKTKKPNLDSVDFLKLVYPDSPSFSYSNWKVFDTKEIAEEWIKNPITLEEKPKQEKLEEAAFKFTANKSVKEIYSRMDFVKGAEFGAKWQAERMYSEEEVMEMFHKLSMHLPLHYEILVRKMFKKK